MGSLFSVPLTQATEYLVKLASEFIWPVII